MAVYEYPYTDFNEYNLDWCIKRIRDLTDEWAATHTEWEDTKTEWENYKNYIDNYFENLNVQDEIDNKLQQMAQDGTLTQVVAPIFADAIAEIPGIVTTWLDDHIVQETGYVIDYSLSTTDAAADAKVTGDYIRMLMAAYGQHHSINLLPNNDTIIPCYIPAGTKVTASTSDGSTFTGRHTVHWYDKNRTHVNWFGMYSPNNKKTYTFTADVYYLQFQDFDDNWTVPYMINLGEFAYPYVDYKQGPDTFEYKGNPAADLNDTRETGWYSLSSSHTNLPTDYYGTAGLLEVFNPALTRSIVIQRLTDSREPSDVWTRYITVDGSTVGNWTKNVTSRDISFDKILETDLSLNGNYFDPNIALWQDGVLNSTTGNVSGAYPYQYALVPLHGAGTYAKTGNKSIFGTQIKNWPLYNQNGVFLTYKAGTSSDGDYVSTITLDAAEGATYAYTAMHRDATDTFVPKLFFNATSSPTRYELDPVYGFYTDKLYKKVICADGDSIANASSDNPKAKGGYFGRFILNYQMTGKNYSSGGGCITNGLTYPDMTPRHAVCTSIDTIYSEYPDLDYLLLEGGTNDADLIGQFIGDTPPANFGTWTENDFSGSYTNTTFCGAVETMFYKAVTYWPTAKIGFIIPMEMGTNNNSLNNRKRYFDEIIKIAAKWHVPVLNLWETSNADARLVAFYDPGLSVADNVAAGKFYGDGQHPTSYGYDAMQDKINAWVRTL